jgi:hypothetical protein
LAEFLFVILAQVPLGGISNNNTANLNGHFNGVMSSKNSISSYNQKRGNSAGSSSSSWQANANNLQCSPHLISLAPYVASLLLNSIFGSNIPPSIDWIFWGLAKVFIIFVSMLTLLNFFPKIPFQSDLEASLIFYDDICPRSNLMG